MEKHSDYSIFEVTLMPTYDFIQHILSMSSEVEVLSPNYVREEVVRWVKEIAKIYCLKTLDFWFGKTWVLSLSKMVKKIKELGVTSHFKGCYTQFLILESCDYSSTAACAAANENWLSARYGKFGKHLGNIMSMYCTFCTRFPQNIRPFLPLRLLFDILIVKHYC